MHIQVWGRDYVPIPELVTEPGSTRPAAMEDKQEKEPRFLPHHIKIMKIALVGAAS